MSRTKRSKPRRSPLTRLRRGEREGGFAMAVSLLLIVTVVGLSAGVAGVVAGEVQPTQVQAKTTLTLNNAQSGIEAALDAIRSQGAFATLPCGPVSGTVSGQSATGGQSATYNATIRYYAVDPTSHVYDSTWLAANVLTCSSTAPAFAVTGTQPSYAFIQSAGDGTRVGGFASTTAGTNAGNRAFHVVYKLGTGTNYTIGGSVGIGSANSTSSTSLCLDANSTAPSAGQSVLTNSCPASGSSTQSQDFQFVPTSQGYQIVFGGNPSANLCLAQSGISAISLLECSSTDSSQAFTKNAAGQLVAVNGQCLGSSSPGGALTTQVCGGANTSINASAQSGLIAASSGVAVGNGGVAVSGSLCVANCAVGVSMQLVSDPSTGTFAASVSISVFGLQLCTTVGVSGGSPVLAFGIGSSCSGQTVVATAAAPSPPAVSIQPQPAVPTPSIVNASLEAVGEDAGGQS